jgi:glutathione synthase/RimK-type ligase-like ATP-grasp enzyme
MTPRVALATCARVPRLTADDDVLREALSHHVHASAVVWDDPGVPWDQWDGIVLRSVWDYHLRHAEFMRWIDQLDSAGIPLWNPASVVRWNADKTYLRHLNAAGVEIVPTAWLDRQDATTLASLMDERGWPRVVVKPSISASAHETRRLARDEAMQAESWLHELRSRSRVLVQPYLPEVAAHGEWSLIFIGGEFSHARLKRPAAGDFRVQRELGGTDAPGTPNDSLIDAARRILAHTPAPCAYARVDGCEIAGRFVLMELEALEPVLYFRHAPHAAARLASLIAAAL